MMPQSLGVIGGKPNSAHYFIGYVGERWFRGRTPAARGGAAGTRLQGSPAVPRVLA